MSSLLEALEAYLGLAEARQYCNELALTSV